MNIPKAIETLEKESTLASEYCLPKVVTAIRLGIEALKRVLATRLLLSHPPADLLPGETEE